MADNILFGVQLDESAFNKLKESERSSIAAANKIKNIKRESTKEDEKQVSLAQKRLAIEEAIKKTKQFGTRAAERELVIAKQINALVKSRVADMQKMGAMGRSATQMKQAVIRQPLTPTALPPAGTGGAMGIPKAGGGYASFAPQPITSGPLQLKGQGGTGGGGGGFFGPYKKFLQQGSLKGLSFNNLMGGFITTQMYHLAANEVDQNLSGAINAGLPYNQYRQFSQAYQNLGGNFDVTAQAYKSSREQALAGDQNMMAKFTTLGVSRKDLEDPGKGLKKVMEGMQEIGDDSLKAGAALQVLGDGAQFTAQNIDKIKEASQDVSGVFSKNADIVKEFQNNMSVVIKILQGFAVALMFIYNNTIGPLIRWAAKGVGGISAGLGALSGGASASEAFDAAVKGAKTTTPNVSTQVEKINKGVDLAGKAGMAAGQKYLSMNQIDFDSMHRMGLFVGGGMETNKNSQIGLLQSIEKNTSKTAVNTDSIKNI